MSERKKIIGAMGRELRRNDKIVVLSISDGRYKIPIFAVEYLEDVPPLLEVCYGPDFEILQHDCFTYNLVPKHHGDVFMPKVVIAEIVDFYGDDPREFGLE